MRLILTLVIVLLIPTATATSQTSDCDFTAFQETLTALSTVIDSGDTDAILTSLSDLQNEIAITKAKCSGLSFSSEADGSQPVLGPIVLGDGVYKVNLDTAGYFQAFIETLDGTCETQRGRDVLFNLSRGQGVNSSAILRASNCTMLLALDNVSEVWTLNFEKVS